MFDSYSFLLFNNLPGLPGLNIEEARRLLSKAYIYSVKMQLGLVQEEFKTVKLETLSEEEIDRIEEEVDQEPLILFNELYHELRRLGDTLESSAVFDNIENEDSVKASSFVAAESLSLLATLLKTEEVTSQIEEGLFSNEFIYTRTEAAMLFLISGYDANAQTEINEVIKTVGRLQNESLGDLFEIEHWCFINLIALFTNNLWNTKRDKPHFSKENNSNYLKNLIRENKFKMFSLLGDSIISYIDWLTGENNDGLMDSLELLTKINHSSYKNKYALYPEVYHFSKVLMVMIKETSKRSLFHNTPLPINGTLDFMAYLKGRTKGTPRVSSRPFIWESAKEFISECLPGPSKHTILNLPTGSGKSFVAELAVTQSLSNGWVLYLAPTNALVHQIKRDLKKSLQFYGSVDIRTFVGGDEYTKLEDEFLGETESTSKFVAVMTPEKCAMSLRINPEIFQECSLCVFDECHLLGEGTRGATVDLVLGQILSISNNVKFVLMSAMLNNPDDLSDWLKNVTTNDSQISSISWKPTRSIRGAVGVEYHSYIATKDEAKINLNNKPEHRKNEHFEPVLSILYSLSGVWKRNYTDYSLMQINSKAKYVLTRRKFNDTWIHGVTATSWVNSTSRSLGFELAVKEIPTIVFIPTNRHYPFTLARDINLNFDDTNLSEIEKNFLMLAENELGVDSEVKSLLSKRVGVHTSYMLETEKEAVEHSFRNQRIKLLFATGTLAQGLNLPSVAVVIAGTRIGDARAAHTPEARLRSKALILNAIGRAGRAGFSNQSLCLIVPNEPIIFKNDQDDIDKTILELDVLCDKDASISVKSPLEQFLDDLLNGSIQSDRASLYELTIMSMLTSDNELEETEKTKAILSKTYAASSMRQKINDEKLIGATLAISKIKNEFLQKANVPEWVIRVARKSGFDFFTTNTFIKLVNKFLPISKKAEVIEWRIKEWKNLLFTCMKELPPYYILRLLPENITQKPTFINKMVHSLGNRFDRDLSWSKPDHWDDYWTEFSDITWLYMEGRSYADIAKNYLHIDGEVESSRSAGKPIPDTLALVKRQIESVSSYAGLLVATLEEVLFKDEALPFSLNALPLAIKNGLKDHSTFYWFSYGLRNRIVAHKLGSILPLDDFIDEETSLRNVLHFKRLWLNNQLEQTTMTSEDREILEAASVILKNQ
jgi:superfamily II DNA/RNA helicase